MGSACVICCMAVALPLCPYQRVDDSGVPLLVTDSIEASRQSIAMEAIAQFQAGPAAWGPWCPGYRCPLTDRHPGEIARDQPDGLRQYTEG
jgi:hypothetical protein